MTTLISLSNRHCPASKDWPAGGETRSVRLIIGVTGSVGKTTTKEAISGLLSLRWRVSRSMGNLNNEIGLPMALLSVKKNPTSSPCSRWALTPPARFATLCEIARPDLGLVSSIGPVHLERFGTMQAIVDAKAELVEALPPSGVALLNGDDPHLRQLS